MIKFKTATSLLALATFIYANDAFARIELPEQEQNKQKLNVTLLIKLTEEEAIEWARVKQAEEEARVRQAEEATRIRQAEEEARVRQAEEATRIRQAEEEARVRQAEDVTRIRQAEEEAARVRAARLAAEEKAKAEREKMERALYGGRTQERVNENIDRETRRAGECLTNLLNGKGWKYNK